MMGSTWRVFKQWSEKIRFIFIKQHSGFFAENTPIRRQDWKQRDDQSFPWKQEEASSKKMDAEGDLVATVLSPLEHTKFSPTPQLLDHIS